jgi:phosphoribosylanthranilate isomerase
MAASQRLLKICGLTTIADLRLAQRCGADFLGVVVDVAASPRSVSLAQAARLVRLCPDRVVAVTTSDDPAELRRLADTLRPRALQLHDPQALAASPELLSLTRLWLAVAIPAATEAPEQAITDALALIEQAQQAGVVMIVLDTSQDGKMGGTGETSDWQVAAEIVRRSPLPVLLAGGISPDNAATALAQVCPAGLDASSRLEISPGRKRAEAVRELGRIVKRPD